MITIHLCRYGQGQPALWYHMAVTLILLMAFSKSLVGNLAPHGARQVQLGAPNQIVLRCVRFYA